MTVTTIQGLRKEGHKKKKNYCEDACDHMALWNFKLRFEPSSLPRRTMKKNKIKLKMSNL
jgi:hypothetical protein